MIEKSPKIKAFLRRNEKVLQETQLTKPKKSEY